MTDKKNYNIIDLVKFLCAILVVTIHTTPFKEYNQFLSFEISNILARIAVPFFFAAAGFFFTMKLSKSNIRSTLTNYLKRLIILYRLE